MTIAIYFLLVETRGSKILEDRARRLTLQTRTLHIADGDNTPQASTFQLIKATASRPILFLLTEPVVAAIATWAALLSVHISTFRADAHTVAFWIKMGGGVSPFLVHSSRL
jgi:hypothetical protein